MTKQEIFDRVVAGLAAQGFKRSTNLGGCAYRGEDGARCAVGHLIPDTAYNPAWEGRAVSEYAAFDTSSDTERNEVQAIIAATGLKVTRENAEFLGELQHAHDQGYECDEEAERGVVDRPSKMKKYLRAVAERHALTIPEVL